MLFEEIIIAHLHHLFGVMKSSELVFLHQNQIAVRNLIQHLVIGELQRLLECGNLSEQAIVSYNFCFAVRFATFLAKADSL